MTFKYLLQLFAAANIALLAICAYLVAPDLQPTHPAPALQAR
jgi:hypothetical protein